ncbi:phosphoribosylaminoimidazole-succinocarboxamide synthase [bacterium BMS3Bbin06]|nr:phosphoribosylaminoimidazole-succinocarboxamide synthase [bacterium BMS3Abin08]GBE35661.1 phosphoribosylaminoimidazole-succinocarboxamide synthase [bacterium BMS3Bbin06]
MTGRSQVGSVKDLEVIKSPSDNDTGIGRFHFSDRYSVFDWGEMPDHIQNKGAAISVLSAYFFERLEDMGIKTHYLGLVENGKRKRLSGLSAPSRIMEITLLRVLKPVEKDGIYDYGCYRDAAGNFLIPLEIIYRNSLPVGSSVFKRLEKGELTPGDLGLAEMPSPGERLREPAIDVSTKLEITDRYISWDEAGEMANLSEVEIEGIREITSKVNKLITDEFDRIGLVNEDGKIELGFSPERSLMVVDVLGTLDECRFTFEGIPVSKEIARIYYRGSSWHEEVERAKRTDRMRWKELVKAGPEPLPGRLRDLISKVYASCTNEITGRDWFPGVPDTREILAGIREFIG